MPVPRSRRPRTTALLSHGLVTLLSAAVLTTVPGTAAARPANHPDPGREGAWAGYSIGRSATEGVPRSAAPRAGGVAGMDVSGHQGAVDWAKAWADGARFSYVKATEGTGFISDSFSQQYDGAASVGMDRGAYHFALPDRASGAAQANYFIDHGGGWLPDGRTLPGALDIEDNPYGEICYGMAPQQMSDWIAVFSNTYKLRTGRYPAIYTTTRWWDRCTGANPDFSANNPLWLARFAPEMGPLPAGWDFQAIWQFANSGIFPGDQNSFNGDAAQLERFTL